MTLVWETSVAGGGTDDCELREVTRERSSWPLGPRGFHHELWSNWRGLGREAVYENVFNRSPSRGSRVEAGGAVRSDGNNPGERWWWQTRMAFAVERSRILNTFREKSGRICYCLLREGIKGESRMILKLMFFFSNGKGCGCHFLRWERASSRFGLEDQEFRFEWVWFELSVIIQEGMPSWWSPSPPSQSTPLPYNCRGCDLLNQGMHQPSSNPTDWAWHPITDCYLIKHGAHVSHLSYQREPF